MNEQEKIEMQLWDYMDNQCTPDEAHRIGNLIATDPLWSEKFAELSALHSSISAFSETEEPSMRFTKNVMDALSATGFARPTRRYINLNVVRGIAAFFILTIASFFTYALLSLQSAGKDSFDLSAVFSRLGSIKMPVIDSNIFQCILWVNVILGLVLFDYLLRRKRTRRAQHH